MIYVFGDSYTYGHNFETNREQRIWPFHLSKKMNQPFINFAAPGGSNWRIARKISSMHFNREDIVIISWTEPSRFEFGVGAYYTSPEPNHGRVADFKEVDGKIVSRRFFNQLTKGTNDDNIKNFNALAYNELFNSNWFEQMFKVMFSSCSYILNQSQCKWCMFNTWCSQYEEPDEIYNIQNYFLKGSDNLSKHIRQNDTCGYWDDREHLIATHIIFKNIEQIYGNLLGS